MAHMPTSVCTKLTAVNKPSASRDHTQVVGVDYAAKEVTRKGRIRRLLGVSRGGLNPGLGKLSRSVS